MEQRRYQMRYEQEAERTRPMQASVHLFGAPANQAAVTIVYEFFGTFLFLILVYALAANGGTSLDFVHLGAGLALGLIMWMFSGVSCNPVITLAQAFTGKMALYVAPWVILFQFGAAMLAGVVVYYVFNMDLSLAAPHIGGMPPFPEYSVVFQELFGSVIHITVFLIASCLHFEGLAPLFVGFSYSVIGLVVGPATGCFLNPWRALAPQIITSTWAHAWTWHVGAIGGSLIAVLFGWAIFFFFSRHYADIRLIFTRPTNK